MDEVHNQNEIIQQAIEDKYHFWMNEHPDLKSIDSSFWFQHKRSEFIKRRNHVQLLRNIKSLNDESKILDMGIAWGMWPHILSQLGYDVTGVDWAKLYSTEGLTQRHPTLKDVHAFDYTTQVWPFPDNTFDLITHYDLIEHIHPPLKHTFNEMYRVLKPGGHIILTTPNFLSLRKRLSMLLGKSPSSQIQRFYEDDPFIEHIKEYSMAELKYYFSKLPWKIQKTLYVNHLFYFRMKSAKWFKLPFFYLYLAVVGLFPFLRDTLVIIVEKK